MSDDTVPVIESTDVTEVLNASCMLVSFHRTAWNAEKTDDTVTEGVKQSTGAKGRIGRFRKNLLANNDNLLDQVVKAMASAYRDHVRMTWPWGTSQYRLLLNTGLLDYLSVLRKNKNIIQGKLEAFIADYPRARDAALQDLGGLAQASQYPSAQEIAAKFSIDCDFDPIPAGAQFPGLPPNIGVMLQKRLQDKIATRMQGAILDTWDQIRSLVQRFANQTLPDGRLHDSVLQQLAEMPARVRAFNVMQDPKLDAVANIIATDLATYGRSALEDATKRGQAHSAAERVLGMLPP